MKKILIIDDEREMLNSLKKILSRRKDFQISLIQDAKKAIQIINTDPFDLIISDLKMKDVSGMDILDIARQKDEQYKVIIISGYGTVEASVEAMRSGASDFLEKPFSAKKLFDSIDTLLNNGTKVKSVSSAKTLSENSFEGIIYQSKEMRQVLDLVQKVAPGETSILITGESGTGKELIARAIHNLSERKLNPFVPVNCGALPENLFESELFGHERGAFTGAVQSKPGLLEFANSGTFFFDEIGDLSLPLQVKLLRMLEERKIRRVGSVEELNIDVRIVAATNKSLEKLVEQELFREDLYYRLVTLAVNIPPLRERKDDILPIAEHLLETVSRDENEGRCFFAYDAREQLESYSWPGNVRELQNVIQRAYLLRTSEAITAEELPIASSNKRSCITDDLLKLSYKEAKEKMLQEFEMSYLKHHLHKNNGNISRTAEECGIDRRTIHRLIKKEDIVI